jgi:hypothetical protein
LPDNWLTFFLPLFDSRPVNWPLLLTCRSFSVRLMPEIVLQSQWYPCVFEVLEMVTAYFVLVLAAVSLYRINCNCTPPPPQ